MTLTCLRCGRACQAGQRFCSACGCVLPAPSVPSAYGGPQPTLGVATGSPVYQVMVQGLDAVLRATGGVEVVELGGMTAEQLLHVFRSAVAQSQAFGAPAGPISISVAGPGGDAQFAVVSGSLREARSGRVVTPEEGFAAVSGHGAPVVAPVTAPIAIDSAPVAEIEADEEEEACAASSRGVRTGSDVPQVSFVMWHWGCRGELLQLVHGFALALLPFLLFAAYVANESGGSGSRGEVLLWGGVALAAALLARALGRVSVHLGIDPSRDALWVKVGEEVRSTGHASSVTRFELDERTWTELVRVRKRTRRRTRRAYRLIAVLGEGRRVRVPQLPEMSWGPANRSLRAAQDLLSLVGRPRA